MLASVRFAGTDHLGGLSTRKSGEGTRPDVGHIPKTVLHITTKYRGTNANTATPVLVDSANNVVDTIDWKQTYEVTRSIEQKATVSYRA